MLRLSLGHHFYYGHFILILFGIREASIMNVIATIGKLVPIVLFIVVMVTAFRWDTFTHDFWGEGTISLSAILGQVKIQCL